MGNKCEVRGADGVESDKPTGEAGVGGIILI